MTREELGTEDNNAADRNAGNEIWISAALLLLLMMVTLMMRKKTMEFR